LSEHVEENKTFAVIPEGVMLNYLTKRKNSSKYINLMLPETTFFGEENIIKNFAKNPPDYIVLVHKRAAEYGVGYFGKSQKYGKGIMEWVNKNYKKVILFGDEPFEKEKQFGIKIYTKNQ
jgi:hypothetical protein